MAELRRCGLAAPASRRRSFARIGVNRPAPVAAGLDHARDVVASPLVMGSLIKKRRKRMRKKKHKKMLKATRWQRRAAGK
jgi:hypothetical protein